jgi:hypothetical protein
LRDGPFRLKTKVQQTSVASAADALGLPVTTVCTRSAANNCNVSLNGTRYMQIFNLEHSAPYLGQSSTWHVAS